MQHSLQATLRMLAPFMCIKNSETKMSRSSLELDDIYSNNLS